MNFEKKKIAVLDLGTNTFNLLVAESVDYNLSILHSSRLAVKLGEGGIGKNIIAPAAFERGLKAIAVHKMTISTFNPEKILAYGTSALRSAHNADEFITEVFRETEIKIEIISGEREAELISKGVLNSIKPLDKTVLILDIGGGSNEFIIANQGKILWKESYPLGMARIIEQFKISDPIRPDEIEILEDYFNKELSSLFNAVQKFKPDTLVGAEGAFESFFKLIDLTVEKDLKSTSLSMESFSSVHHMLLQSTQAERKNMKCLEPYRVEMIVPASIFVNFVLEKLKLNKIIVSFFSLKEGAAIEYFGIS